MTKEYNVIWDKLLSEERFRNSTTTDNHRNSFQKDYDRIIYSSALRRLQDKTQVFPLQKNDFIRTRLTHSLEASAIARSLGSLVGTKLIEKRIWDDENAIERKNKLSSLLEVSGLVHDIGNPPFGHFGETIIREFFKKWILQRKVDIKEFIGNDITDEELKVLFSDFIKFEGNAQGIRILTKLQRLNDKHGVNFTFGTLATLMKYPWDSLNKLSENGKFGYFKSEKAKCEEIRKHIHLSNNSKHPVTLLLEASDDIAYLFADLEDAVKKGLISWSKIKNKFNSENYCDNNIKEYIKKNKKFKNKDDLICMQNFKIIIQGYFINEVCEEFIKNHNEILSGKYEGPLLTKSKKTCKMEKIIRSLCVDYAYSSKEVLKLEIIGNSILTTLLDIFVNSMFNLLVFYYKESDGKENKERENIFNKTFKRSKSKDQKLFNLISDNFRDEQNLSYKLSKKDFLYKGIQLIVDYISCMTDSYALNLHKQITGNMLL